MNTATKPVLGRDEELQAADSGLRAAEQGAGSLVVIEGPAGIGKTSLLAAIARRAERRGLICLSATAREASGSWNGLWSELCSR
ncbi:MAG: ATP-binding protein, partial [Solirubrobacteraceae bacterium]